MDEVRYERLRPKQVVARREACPVAYVPIGTIEWHGFHNPVGLDTLKAHALAVRCARAGGGLVFPPLWYGECRELALMEANAADRERIAAGMGLPPENFAPGYMHRSPQEQYDNYQKLLLHALFEVESLGFQVIVLVAGHYPLIDHARAAVCIYQQGKPRAIAWAFTGYELVKDEFPEAGDHAGHWETSLLLALDGEGVDLSELPTDSAAPLVGVGRTQPPVQEASAAYGERAVRAVVARVTAAVRDRLDNPARYRGHGARL
ncbi:MAG: creatininase family protein [Armatimonadetes bacterium]|nr:creatininase family protein [Armatimonadota bacterium]